MRANEQGTMVQKASYTNLDIAKFICSLLVIMIHTEPFSDHPIAHFYTVNVIARTAVPLFFGISGFLLFGKMSYENGKLIDSPRNRSRMLRYLKRNLDLYLLWSVIYLLVRIPQWYLCGWWGWVAVKDAVHAFLTEGIFGHLWYLLSLIWAVPMMYLLLLVIPMSKLRLIAAALWVFQSLDTTYSWLWNERMALMVMISDKLPILYTSTRCALPLMTFGASYATDRQRRGSTTRLCRFLLVCVIWIAEVSAIYFSVPAHDLFSSPLVAPLFVYFTLDFLIAEHQIPVPIRTQSIMRVCNTVIYCLHPLLIHLLKNAGMVSGIPFWLLTTVSTVGLAYVWAQRKIKL